MVNDEHDEELHDEGLLDSEEEALFIRFVNLVPAGKVVPRVRTFFEQQGERELRLAFGDPRLLLDSCTDDLSEGDLITKEAVHRLREGVTLLLTPKEWKAKAITEDALQQETGHARTELARHWLDTLLLAFELGKVRSQLHIETDFIPRKGSLGNHEAEWEKIRHRSRTSLLNNVALSSDGVSALSREYFSSLGLRVKQQPLQIPGRFEFAGQPQDIVLRRVGTASPV